MPLDILSIVISVIALLISGFIFIKDYLLSAKIEVFLGDNVQIACKEKGDFGSEKKLILNCNFTNTRNNLGVINGAKLQLTAPNGSTYKFYWKYFCRWEMLNATHDGLPRALSVLAKSSIFQIITFVSEKSFDWTDGKYKLSFCGWYNREPNKSDSNISNEVDFTLDKTDVNELNQVQTVNANVKVKQIKIFHT